MKTIVFIVVVLVLLGGSGIGYWRWRVVQAAGATTKPAAAAVTRGDLKAVVTCTGKVASKLDVDIKCKASGVVIRLPFDISDAVHEGDLLVELDPVDEQRNVAQSEASLKGTDARLATAQQNYIIAQENLKTSRMRAEATLASSQARARDARSKADHMQQLLVKKLVSQEDADTAETAAAQADADVTSAQAMIEDLKAQDLSLELRRQDVKVAESQDESDRIALSIAKQRLADTKVYAPPLTNSADPEAPSQAKPGATPAAGAATRPAGDHPVIAVVTALNVQVGGIIQSGTSNVSGGTTVMTLSDLSQIFVLASVDESDIGRVELGQKVNVTADAYRGQRFGGRVVRIAAKGVNVSNVVTFEVKIEVTSPNKARLKPEMTTNIEIVVAERNNVLSVPNEALVRKAGKPTVTLDKGDGSGEERTVETGITDGTRTEIVSGLEEGQSVQTRKSDADSRWRPSATNAQPPRPPGAFGPGR